MQMSIIPKTYKNTLPLRNISFVVKSLISILFISILQIYITIDGYAQSTHPNKRLFPYQEYINISNKEISKSTIHKLTKQREKITVIGKGNGPPIGKITDINVHEGRIFILDGESDRVHVYRNDGSYSTSFGRKGQGPGEFVSANNLTIDSKDHIWAVDDNNTVSIFSKNHSEYKHNKTFTVNFSPQAVCADKYNVYIYGLPSPTRWKEGHKQPIRTYTLEGEKMQSMGEIYKSDNILVAGRMSELSDITCSQDGIAYLQYRYLPVLYTLDLNSEAYNWGIFYDEFETVEWKAINKNGRPGIRHTKPKDGTVFGKFISITDRFIVSSNLKYNQNGKNKGLSIILKRNSSKSTRIEKNGRLWVYIGSDISIEKWIGKPFLTLYK